MLTRSTRSRTRLSEAVEPTDLTGTSTCQGQQAYATRSAKKKPSPPSSTIEQSVESTVTDVKPTMVSQTDVLLGRGRHIESHAGNVQFHQRMEKHLQGYQALRTRPAKNRYTVKIVNQMKKSGIRFLKQISDSDGASEDRSWYVVDDEKARIKVGQSLRYMRRRNSSDGASSSKSKATQIGASRHRSLNEVGPNCRASSVQPPVHPSGSTSPAITTSNDQGLVVYLEDWDQDIPAGGDHSSPKGIPVRVDDFFMPDV